MPSCRAQGLRHLSHISEPHNHGRALSRALRGAQIPSYSAGLTEQLTLNSTNIFNSEGRVFGVEDNAIVEVVYAEKEDESSHWLIKRFMPLMHLWLITQ